MKTGRLLSERVICLISMKKVIRGHLLDTETAKLIGSYFHECSNYTYEVTDIYQENTILFVHIYFKSNHYLGVNSDGDIHLLGVIPDNPIQDYREYWEED